MASGSTFKPDIFLTSSLFFRIQLSAILIIKSSEECFPRVLTVAVVGLLPFTRSMTPVMFPPNLIDFVVPEQLNKNDSSISNDSTSVAARTNSKIPAWQRENQILTPKSFTLFLFWFALIDFIYSEATSSNFSSIARNPLFFRASINSV